MDILKSATTATGELNALAGGRGAIRVAASNSLNLGSSTLLFVAAFSCPAKVVSSSIISPPSVAEDPEIADVVDGRSFSPTSDEEAELPGPDNVFRGGNRMGGDPALLGGTDEAAAAPTPAAPLPDRIENVEDAWPCPSAVAGNWCGYELEDADQDVFRGRFIGGGGLDLREGG